MDIDLRRERARKRKKLVQTEIANRLAVIFVVAVFFSFFF